MTPSDRVRLHGGALVAGVVLFACLFAAGCSPTPPAPAPASPAPAASPAATGSSEVAIDPQLLEPLAGLGPCKFDPKPMTAEPTEAAVFPDDTVVTEQQANGPLTSIKGYIPMTPVQIRVFYQEQDRYDVIQVEDEIRESEVLLGDGANRLFVKAQAVCELGSVFLAVLAPESAGNAVPTPAGGGGGGGGG